MIILLLIIIACVLLLGRETTKSLLSGIVIWIIAMAILANIFM